MDLVLGGHEAKEAAGDLGHPAQDVKRMVFVPKRSSLVRVGGTFEIGTFQLIISQLAPKPIFSLQKSFFPNMK